MSGKDLTSILPLLILAGGMILEMLLLAVKRNHKLSFIFTIAVLVLSIVSVFVIESGLPHAIGDLFLIDRFAVFYLMVILLATLVVSVFAYVSIENFFPEKRKEEFYLLLMIAALGAAAIVISTQFISFFVSLEILSVSLYSLISYYREQPKPIEAGLKYLIIAAMSSAFLLFGMALIYAVSGNMTFESIANLNLSPGNAGTVMVTAGLGLMIVGIGFKLAVVPFHAWTPDVYEGASSPVTAFIASVSKGAVIALLIRFFVMADLYSKDKILLVFIIISILSMLIGNLLALMQNNVKRILAYSSIAHLGYALVALISGKEFGPQAATFYITTYIITILAAFGLVTLFSNSDKEATDIEDYKGLFWRKPFHSVVFVAVLLSLAGIPLTAGFIGKYYILTSGVGNAFWTLAIVLVISSVIGLFYYLRIIAVMMKQEDSTQSEKKPLVYSISGVAALAVLGILIVWFGIYPTWLINLVNSIALF